MSEQFASVCVAWNKSLGENIQMFSNAHPDVRCFEFSSYKCLSDILDHPVKHGFIEDDVTRYGGAIWADNIHLTGAVHETIAQDVWEYLMTI
jgi:phospholipase/lecithinase/hemolysin